MLAALALACLNTAGNAERSPAAAAKVHIFTIPPRQAVPYGMSKLQEALEARGIQVSEGTTIAADADFVIVARGMRAIRHQRS